MLKSKDIHWNRPDYVCEHSKGYLWITFVNYSYCLIRKQQLMNSLKLQQEGEIPFLRIIRKLCILVVENMNRQIYPF